MIKEGAVALKNIVVGIFENIPAYGKRLAGYISGCDQSPFLVRLYLEHPAALPETGLDVCIVSSALWPGYGALLEGMPVLILDENGTMPRDGDIRTTLKYQSAADIYQILLDVCMEAGKWRIASAGPSKQGFEVWGIYTPVRDAACENQVGRYIEDLAARFKVLCLCLEPVYTGRDMENGPGGGTFSEVIYYLKQEKQSLGSRITMMASHGGCDLILPPASAGEAMELNAGEWRRLMDVLREETAYERVLLDFGAGNVWPGAAGCLKKLLILQAPDDFGDMVSGRFRQLLQLMTEGTPPVVETVIQGAEMKGETA